MVAARLVPTKKPSNTSERHAFRRKKRSASRMLRRARSINRPPPAVGLTVVGSGTTPNCTLICRCFPLLRNALSASQHQREAQTAQGGDGRFRHVRDVHVVNRDDFVLSTGAASELDSGFKGRQSRNRRVAKNRRAVDGEAGCPARKIDVAGRSMPGGIIEREAWGEQPRIVDALNKGAVVEKANLVVVRALRLIRVIGTVGISRRSGDAPVVAPCIKTEAENAEAAWIFAYVGARSRRAVNRGVNKREMKAIRGRGDWRLNLELKRKVGPLNRSRLGLVEGGYILQRVDSVRYLQAPSRIAASNINYRTGTGGTKLRQRHRCVAGVSGENYRRRLHGPNGRGCSDGERNEIGQFHFILFAG